jgi:hypothetical protein
MTTQRLTDKKHVSSSSYDMTTQRLTDNKHATQRPKNDLSLTTVLERNPRRNKGSDGEYEEPDRIA